MRSREIADKNERARVRDENVRRCRRIWEDREDFRRSRIERNAREVAALTPTERLARLDERLGFGLGATKERARLVV